MKRQAKDKGKRMRDLILPPVTDFQALFLPVSSYMTGTLIADTCPTTASKTFCSWEITIGTTRD